MALGFHKINSSAARRRIVDARPQSGSVDMSVSVTPKLAIWIDGDEVTTPLGDGVVCGYVMAGGDVSVRMIDGSLKKFAFSYVHHCEKK